MVFKRRVQSEEAIDFERTKKMAESIDVITDSQLITRRHYYLLLNKIKLYYM